MKKSAIIVAVLAVILATSSSFTFKSKSAYYYVNRWETFGVSPNTMNGDPYPNTGSEIYSAKISDCFAGQATSFIEALLMNLLDVDTYITNFNCGQFPSSVICSSDNQHICVATIAYYNSINNGGTLVDFNYGDYTLDSGF
jgi:hypothetical protein